MSDERNIAELISIDGVWLPGIREYHFTLEDIDSDDSNRSEAGIMHRSVLRDSVYHAQVTHICNQTDMITVCEAVKGDTQIEVTVLCPGRGDPYEIIDAYVSKLDCQLITNLDSVWWQISYTLVEV